MDFCRIEVTVSQFRHFVDQNSIIISKFRPNYYFGRLLIVAPHIVIGIVAPHFVHCTQQVSWSLTHISEKKLKMSLTLYTGFVEISTEHRKQLHKLLVTHFNLTEGAATGFIDVTSASAKLRALKNWREKGKSTSQALVRS
jgi:hypothetical protein